VPREIIDTQLSRGRYQRRIGWTIALVVLLIVVVVAIVLENRRAPGIFSSGVVPGVRMGIGFFMQRFWAGFIVALLVLAGAGLAAVKLGLVPASADVPPSKMERRLAQMSLNATVARDAPRPPYPYPSSNDAITAGSKLYIQHCSICHGTAVGGPPIMARGLYIKPPQFVKNGVDDDPEGKIYWNIEHGVRFTGMPSYKTQLTEEQIWQLAYFLKSVPDHLPPAAQLEWHKPAE